MKMPAPTWTTTYSASRRKHNHRCRCCSRIVRNGEPVVMARVRGRKTKVLHVDCAARASAVGMTEGELLALHGLEYLAALGYQEAARRLGQQRVNQGATP